MFTIEKFKKENDFSKRLNTTEKLISKYPDRLPVIVIPYKKNDPTIDKNKFLAPVDITVGKFLYEVRKHLKIRPEQALFLYYENILINCSSLMSTVYMRYKDRDGFLYLIYSTENTFG